MAQTFHDVSIKRDAHRIFEINILSFHPTGHRLLLRVPVVARLDYVVSLLIINALARQNWQKNMEENLIVSLVCVIWLSSADVKQRHSREKGEMLTFYTTG